ncbi:hypothetical protein SKAU_G00213710 [Synaphobranchus kaupii]|uniref:VWFA domain-containing protein n=1 Tax=Synaphobranchus kaupii TaxID=118154 RepID=A0A9Q1F9E5_SYNKA|nr:hypothetical protein SKAU_G00213710 [Synaphobranchus kaupii]
MMTRTVDLKLSCTCDAVCVTAPLPLYFLMDVLLKTALLMWALQVSALEPEYDSLVIRPANKESNDDCPINVYFIIDTSESVALREEPWGSLVDELKTFLKMFVEKLEATSLRSSKVQWAYGGLHFSDRVEIFSQVTSDASIFLARAKAIRYIGRGTFIDCALRNMTEQVRRVPQGKPRLQFAVVLTDGHVTGSPCGGVQQAAEAAKAAGMKIFVVATDQNTVESELKQIASPPAELYRKDYLAFPRADRDAAVRMITDTMVKEGEFVCQEQMCLQTAGMPGPKGYRGSKGAKGTEGGIGDPGSPGQMGDSGIEGPIGLPGQKGVLGLKGERGDMGALGPKGQRGASGFSGIDGEKGKAGTIGSPGCKGDPGMPGDHGPPGDFGIKGDTGGPGEKGVAGQNGRLGPQGPRGGVGQQGVRGYVGNPGLPGQKGAKGNPGPGGDPGNPGSRGDSGKVGLRGGAGSKGDKGEVGLEGERGPAGGTADKGVAGPPGFPGFRGPHGDEGAPGRQGSPGEAGDFGPRGDIGKPGAKGDQGKNGYNFAGPRGVQGDRGELGFQGLPGSRGYYGGKGEQGPKGPTGVIGEPGPTGVPGDRGTRGSPGPRGSAGSRGPSGLSECEIMGFVRETCGCCDCEKVCPPLDLVFVIDSSESIGKTNFSLAKNFVISVANRLGKMAKNISDTSGSRLGVVQYSHQETMQAIRMDDASITSVTSFKAKVKAMEWIAGGTWTPSALKFTYEKLIVPSRRSGTKVVAIVITDGRYDPKDVDNLEALCGGVEVYAIAIGDMFHTGAESQNLVEIACNIADRVKTLSLYAELTAEEFLEEIELILCPEPENICPDPKCTSDLKVAPLVQRPVDILFFVDGSERTGAQNFVSALRFIEMLSQEIPMAKKENDYKGARFAVLQFGGESPPEVLLDFSYSQSSISNVVNRAVYRDSSSALGEGIIFAADNLVNNRGGRYKGVRQLAERSFVFITDGVTSDKNFEEGIRAMRKANVVSTAIAVGPNIDRERLMQLVFKDRALIFHLKRYKDLAATQVVKHIAHCLG